MMEKEALCMRKINLKRKVNVNLNMFIALNLSEVLVAECKLNDL